MSKKKKIGFRTYLSMFLCWPVYRYCCLLILGLIDRWEEKQEAENSRGRGEEGKEEGKEREKGGQEISQAFQRKSW